MKIDERLRKTTIDFLKEYADKGYENAVECIDWLEKQDEKEITWDKEDEENMNNVLYILNQLKDTSAYKEDDVVEKIINWLKSIKDRLCPDNEYDKDMLEAIEYCLKNNRPLEREHFVWLKKYCEQKLADDAGPKDYNSIDPHFGRAVDGSIDPHFGKPIDTKQVETKPKTKPKFEVGQWVVYNRTDNSREIIQVYDIRDGRYYFTDNVHFSWSVEECDEKSHLWSIEDVRPGDILAFDDSEHILLVKESHDSTWGWRLSCWCHLLDGDFEVVEYHTKVEGLHPATNPQRDVFMKAMEEAGYTFDFEKKELKKTKKKFTWSEEDSVRLQRIIDFLWTNRKGDTDTIFQQEQDIEWLKSIKEKFKEN